MPCEEVEPNRFYTNDEFGGEYRVRALIPDLTGCERTRDFGRLGVLYTQMVDGEVFQAGQVMTRAVEDFKANFTLQD